MTVTAEDLMRSLATDLLVGAAEAWAQARPNVAERLVRLAHLALDGIALEEEAA